MRATAGVISVAMLIATATIVLAQTAADSDNAKLPAPGSKGNADNVPLLDAKKDAKGNPIRLAKATGHVSNYSEDKIPPYTLPGPLVTNDGKPVTSADMWLKVRRPEILKFYENEIYGRVPASAPKVTWEVTETVNGDAADSHGAGIIKHVVGRIGDKPDGPKINLTEYLPANAKGPVPLLLSISFNFPAGGAKAAKGPPRAAFDPIAELMGRGWGYAKFDYTEVQPDRANSYKQGVIGLTLKEGQDKPAPDEWGSIKRLGLGHQPRHRLFGNRQSREPEANYHHRRFAPWQNRALGRRRIHAWPPCSPPSPARWAPLSSAAIGAKRSTTWRRTSPGSLPATCKNGPAAGTNCPSTSTCSSHSPRRGPFM